MSISRYKNDSRIRGGRGKASARAIVRIRRARSKGRINYRIVVLKEKQRLDKLAAEYFGDGRLWWVIALMSDIGWGLQVPPGTRLKIPTDMTEFMGLI